MKTKLILSLLTSVLLNSVFGVAVASVTGWNPALVGATTFGLSTLSITPQGALLTAIDNSALVASLGDYYRKTKDFLHTTLLLGMNVEDRVEIWDDISDECPLPNLTMTNIVKPGIDPTFSPTANAMEFDARILKVRNWKIDLLVTPTELHKTWLGYKKQKGSNVYDMPFEQFIFNHIIEKANDDIRRNAFMLGIYNAVGTAPADIFDGFGKKLDDAATAGDFVKVATPLIDATNIIGFMEDVYDDLDEAYKMAPDGQILVGPELFVLYNRAYRNEHGPNNNYTGQGITEIPLDGTTFMVKREPGLIGSQRIVATVKSNLVYGIDSMSDLTNFNIQQFDRQLKIMIDAKGGVELKQTKGGAVAMNDQA